MTSGGSPEERAASLEELAEQEIVLGGELLASLQDSIDNSLPIDGETVGSIVSRSNMRPPELYTLSKLSRHGLMIGILRNEIKFNPVTGNPEPNVYDNIQAIVRRQFLEMASSN